MLKKKHIKYLIVHCSDSPDNIDLSAIDIHRMHLEFGWDGIGYHKIISRSGLIENGRPEYWIGAHTYGKNSVSLGVCLIGRKKFLKKQLSSLKQVLVIWKIKYPEAKILGHCEAIKTSKTCPNFNLQSWLKSERLVD